MSNESAETRVAGYYWVLDLNQGNHPVICEWCPHSDGHGYWWSIGSGAYDDSPCIERVLSGTLEPPRASVRPQDAKLAHWAQLFETLPLPAPEAPRVQRSEPGGYAEPTRKRVGPGFPEEGC